ncbi:hypothetical protein AB8O64_35640 (plasmid) [Streptomyces sp. QH1-20]|uniref:hypothetical protein n=1 Tax=Streptomyces sp. QH1-20 TaxID=3240934 RepID=UPI003517D90E
MTTSTEANSTLVVPVRLRALRVTDETKNTAVQRWLPNFHMMEMGEPVEPPAFQSLDADWNRRDADKPAHLHNNGVHLHWELPAGLRRATPDPTTGELTFPAAPNRWLIYRWHGEERRVTAWIVESDHIGPRTGTSPYYVRETGTKTRIGRAVQIINDESATGEPWTEPLAGVLSPLTAIGPGLPTFSLYQPYHRNVFSFYDDLSNVPEGQNQVPLAYMVVGWHSHPDQDPLRTMSPAQLGWAPTVSGAYTSSVYAGNVAGVPVAAAFHDTIPAPGSINGAVGTSSADALTHLSTRELQESEGGKQVARLVAALQNGLLARMDDPDAEHLLDEYLHGAGFTPQPGGSRFELTGTHGGEDDLQAFAFLTQLNKDQAAFEDLDKHMRSLQRRLYLVWRLSSLPSRPGDISQDDFDRHLDPQRKGGYAALITALKAPLEEARGKIPGSAAPGGEDPATRWAHAHGLGSRYSLKRVLQEPFHRPNNPAVLLHKAGGEDTVAVDNALPCRPVESLLTDLHLSDNDTVASLLSQAGSSLSAVTRSSMLPTALPFRDITEKIAAEACLVDIESSAVINRLSQGKITRQAMAAALDAAKQDPATVPLFGTQAWAQPWNPLYLVWKAKFYPLPHGEWEFDGNRYQWKGHPKQKLPTPVALQGRAILGHHARFHLRSRISEYIANGHTTSPDMADHLRDFGATVDSWDLISQTLDGFAAQLTRHDPARALRTSGAAAALAGRENNAGPLPGEPPEPFEDGPESEFQEIPAGQYRFTHLAIVDSFGRTTAVHQDESGDEADTFPLGVSPDMAPVRPILEGGNTAGWLEQHPRLPEAARITVDFTHPEDDTKPYTTAGTLSPVIAWVIPNWIDNTLLAYTAEGHPIGEIRVTAGSTQRQVTWGKLPGSQKQAPKRLKNILDGLQAAGAEAFEEMMTAIYGCLETINPLSGAGDTVMASILGRPLALTRIAVHLNSHADVTRDTPAVAAERRTVYRIADPTWETALSTSQERLYASHKWPVRLGDGGRLGDGLVGFWDNDAAPSMRAFYVPNPDTPSYVHPMGTSSLNVSAQEGPRYLTALIDPRAPIHATTGILPVTRAHIPARFIDQPLSVISPALRTGPLLVPALPESADGSGTAQPTAVRAPVPSLRSGSWQWTEATSEDAWTSVPASTHNPDETFSLKSPTARSGFLTQSSQSTPSHGGNHR